MHDFVTAIDNFALTRNEDVLVFRQEYFFWLSRPTGKPEELERDGWWRRNDRRAFIPSVMHRFFWIGRAILQRDRNCLRLRDKNISARPFVSDLLARSQQLQL